MNNEEANQARLKAAKLAAIRRMISETCAITGHKFPKTNSRQTVKSFCKA